MGEKGRRRDGFFTLKVEFDATGIESVPSLYVNYAQVRANPEDTTIALCQRQDLAGAIEGEFMTSKAIPRLVLNMTTAHAIRLAEAILKQAKAFEDSTNEK